MNYKKQIKIVFAVCSLLLLGGCTQEKEFVNEHNHGKIDFKEKSFKEALSLPLFNNAIQKVAKKRGAFRGEDDARTALEDQYGFTIVTDAPIRIITDENGTVFYTILIEREIKEEMVFENLMIKVQDDETAAVILKYTMGEKGTQSENGEYVITGITDTEYTDLNLEGKMFFNGNGDTCFDTNVILCDFADTRPAGHIATASCWYHFNNAPNASNIYYGTSVVCMNDGFVIGGGGGGTGGTGGTDGSSNNTGGLGASGGSSDPIVISPIPCRTGNCIEADITKKPCAQLKKLADTDKLNIKPKIDILKSKVIANVQKEWGVNFKKVGLTALDTPDSLFTYDTILVEGNANDVLMSFGDDWVGSAHLHTSNGYAIYAWKDVYNLYLAYRDAKVNSKDDVALILVVKDPFNLLHPKVYAIKVDDLSALQIKVTQDLNNPTFYDPDINETYLNLNENLESLFKESASLERAFVQKFTSYGISLYEAADDSLTEWHKLALDPISPMSPNGIKRIPCIFQ